MKSYETGNLEVFVSNLPKPMILNELSIIKAAANKG